MDIVAEGVETEVEASVMRLVGVTELQGFHFSRPVPREAIAELVTTFNQASVPAAAAITETRAIR
jgi:EAL domain-containing protein (putative c-di-GMP-specific phosphodiesterase class I)